MIATVAPGATSGSAQILQNGVMSNAVPFGVNSLHITGVDPASGLPGTSVTFTGTGFGPSQGIGGTVWLGSTAGQVLSWSDTQVVAAVAAAALTGVAKIQQNGAWSNAMGFTVPIAGGNTLMPAMVTMAVGDMRTLQALGATGQTLTGLTWTSSDTARVSLSGDNPPVLTALAAGHVTITVGTATTDVTVVDASTLPGGTLPVGTVLWSNPGNGSGVTSIVPAVPSPSGVADVFAFQNDGTVQAITSDGTTAWTAEAKWGLPDFQGGLILWGLYSIWKLDGITGQSYPKYTLEDISHCGLYYNYWGQQPAIHTDGTIFTVEGCSVVGIDPVTGTKKFSVEIPDSEDHQAEQYGVMIAGDGYAYVPYAYRTGGNPQSNHFRVLRISSSGAWDDIKVMDFTGPGTGDDFSPYDVYMMTNADQGIVLNWEGVEGPGWQRTPRMAITTGTSASIISMPSVPGQDVAFPVLQAQDGTFLGTSGPYMIDFDATGKVLWSVAGNYAPTIATADGGVIAQSYDPDTGELTGTVTFDQNGNATGQMASLPTYSWLGNAYQDGPVNQVLATPPKRAASFSPNPGANPSGNTTAVKRVPTTLVITKVLSVIQDCYSSLGNSSSGSYAQRNITYEVADQYKSRMDGGMQIQERLLPASDTPCPKGTNWQSGACVGDWINKDDEFPDTLSANPGTGHSEYIQTFWVATPPSTPGYAPFYGQIQIDAYKPSPSGASSLTLTQFVVDVNGNTGMNPNGPPIRRCH